MIKTPVKKPEIVDAIGAIDSSRVVQVVNEDYDQIIWHNGNPNNITTDQIKTKLADKFSGTAEGRRAAQMFARSRFLHQWRRKQELSSLRNKP